MLQNKDVIVEQLVVLDGKHSRGYYEWFFKVLVSYLSWVV